ncbi:hypothetical protein F0562_014542 [Nyssa sinensis]|uniref:Uncharacterized protein n=1 Tax=Nyssa sinensis TaxID=561372 RepID=A0A5J4ZRC5_9ASTE|nr:hypothetical protein F0562_014542 [Nyssa sinensis]
MPLTEWGLHLLTSLRYVEINNVHAELVSFPDFPDNDEYYCGLPATLTSLSIGGLQNLESLSSKGLQNLISLKELHIRKCPKLRSLPKDGRWPFYLSIKFFRPTCGSQDGINQRQSPVFSISHLNHLVDTTREVLIEWIRKDLSNKLSMRGNKAKVSAFQLILAWVYF